MFRNDSWWYEGREEGGGGRRGHKGRNRASSGNGHFSIIMTKWTSPFYTKSDFKGSFWSNFFRLEASKCHFSADFCIFCISLLNRPSLKLDIMGEQSHRIQIFKKLRFHNIMGKNKWLFHCMCDVFMCTCLHSLGCSYLTSSLSWLLQCLQNIQYMQYMQYSIDFLCSRSSICLGVIHKLGVVHKWRHHWLTK